MGGNPAPRTEPHSNSLISLDSLAVGSGAQLLLVFRLCQIALLNFIFPRI
jgi:hypothetical protein